MKSSGVLWGQEVTPVKSLILFFLRFVACS
ncbi:hypothetical protein SAMN05216168_2121 [Kosakonia radicincitans]|nr:hypothetical protein SAMN05216168_2121 [Kosakonia radicincitans]